MSQLQYWFLNLKASQVSISFFAIHLVIISVISYVLAKKWNCVNNKMFWVALIYHLAAGISVGLIYTYYYNANDTFYYFNTASQLGGYAKDNFFAFVFHLFDSDEVLQFNNIVVEGFRSIVFLKFLSLFALASGNNYWICASYFSLLSFISSWFIYREITTQFDASASAAALSFLFFPSIVFWSSGIEKETLTLSSLYFLSVIFLRIYFRKPTRKTEWIIFLISSAVLWLLKYYWAGVFFIAAITALVIQQLSNRYENIEKHLALSYAFTFFLISVVVSFLHPNFYFNRFLDVMISNHHAFVTLSKNDNLIHFHHLNPSLLSVIINSPLALFSGFFRPMIGEGNGWLGVFASFENFIILILFLSALINYKRIIHTRLNLLAVAVISYCVVLCIFLAISTPNLGTLSRYRVGFLPFLIFIFAYRNTLFAFLTKKFLK